MILVYHRGGSRVLTEGVEPVWSSRGMIAFTRVSGRGGIYLIDPRSGRIRYLTRGAEPDWSPDGRRLVFDTGRSLDVIYANGTGRRRLAHSGAPCA